MKPIFTLLTGLLLIVCLLAGCDSLRQEVNPDTLPTVLPKLVVGCFISPQDTVLAASVTRSAPVLSAVATTGLTSPVTNATVTLSDGTTSLPLRYTVVYAGTGGYFSNIAYYRGNPKQFPIVAGRTYTLTVATPDGSRVSATCTVPLPIPIESIVLDSGRTGSFDANSDYLEYYARLRWRDPAGQTNYYRADGDSDFFNPGTISQPGKPTRDTLYRNNGLWRHDGGYAPVQTDASRDGEVLQSARATLAGYYQGNNGRVFRQPPRPVTGYLLHTDVNYYRYHEAFLRQYNNEDNPFAEPAPIPTNIDGGLGCFGAYNRTSIRTILR
jgi:hypothetical protein